MATTKIGNAGVMFPDSSVQSSAGATSINSMTVAVSSGTWTKPATVKSIKVTVVGGGGNSGSVSPTQTPTGVRIASSGSGGGGGSAIRYYPANSLPGPQPFTVGGAAAASSFGVAPITVITGSAGGSSSPVNAPPATPLTGENAAGGAGSNGQLNVTGGSGGGGGGGGTLFGQSGSSLLYGGGAVGVSSPSFVPGNSGAAGVVIIEEFY